MYRLFLFAFDVIFFLCEATTLSAKRLSHYFSATFFYSIQSITHFIAHTPFVGASSELNPAYQVRGGLCAIFASTNRLLLVVLTHFIPKKTASLPFAENRRVEWAAIIIITV